MWKKNGLNSCPRGNQEKHPEISYSSSNDTHKSVINPKWTWAFSLIWHMLHYTHNKYQHDSHLESKLYKFISHLNDYQWRWWFTLEFLNANIFRMTLNSAIIFVWKGRKCSEFFWPYLQRKIYTILGQMK